MYWDSRKSRLESFSVRSQAKTDTHTQTSFTGEHPIHLICRQEEIYAHTDSAAWLRFKLQLHLKLNPTVGTLSAVTSLQASCPLFKSQRQLLEHRVPKSRPFWWTPWNLSTENMNGSQWGKENYIFDPDLCPELHVTFVMWKDNCSCEERQFFFIKQLMY